MNDLLETTELPRVGDRVTDGNRSGKLEKIINLKQGQKLAQVAWDNGHRSDTRLTNLKKLIPVTREAIGRVVNEVLDEVLGEAPVGKPVFEVGDQVQGRTVTAGDRIGTVVGWSMSGMLRVRLETGKVSLIDPATAKKINQLGSSDQTTTFEPVQTPETSSLAAFEGADQESSSYIDLAAQINALNTQGLEAEQTAVAAGRAALELRKELGDRLVQAKATIESELGYGQWGKWLLVNCPAIQPRMASTYMRLSREWEQIQGQAGEEPLTLRGAIAILQGKPLLPSASEAAEQPSRTFEEVAEAFAPWGVFERNSDPKFKFKLTVFGGQEYYFRGFNEAMRWHEEKCQPWNTIEAREKQALEVDEARSCVSCQHRQLIGDGSEFRCHAKAIEYGVTDNPAPGCRLYKARFMVVSGAAIAQSTSETVSEVTGKPDDFSGGGPQAGDPLRVTQSDRVTPVLTVMPEYPTPQSHPAGVLASSARNAKRAQTEEEAEKEAEKDERYTPDYIWRACLAVCGGDRFELDPATNDRESPNVPCAVAYTKAEDGLQQDWSAESIWLNPPYSRIAEFTSKYLTTWENGRFNHGFFLAKGDFSTKWAQYLLKTCTAVALLDHRLTFGAPGRNLETSFFASMVFYHGVDLGAFVEKLEPYGTIMVGAGPGLYPESLTHSKGRAALVEVAGNLAMWEEEYRVLVAEHLQVGDRILLQGSLGKGKEWEVIGRDGDEVRLIGPFFDDFEPGERLLRDRDNPTTLHISEVRRIVSGGAA